jgi:hypothetical protein
MQQTDNRRLVAWIDGVGGYLICLGEEVVLGQPGGDAQIPILADLSRRQASIRRAGEAYVLTPVHPVAVGGVPQSAPILLEDQLRITLGASVELRFRQPHALSRTALLTLESHHQTEPSVDAIVLMSETCVLGAPPSSHIVCRHWTDTLVLFRRDDQLWFRTTAAVAVDGAPPSREGAIGTRLEGEQMRVSFEEI